eukprot:TRINITY_DN5119_c0_g1_i2.p1 TRINITY_DN5119_c0_g1~~TRINITY_DN5119_c0_g1_i2.p1  ORF type:complete len:160 (+),score=37.74 TRINITY_DN5119_c0_g1_i2:365-844(+)
MQLYVDKYRQQSTSKRSSKKLEEEIEAEVASQPSFVENPVPNTTTTIGGHMNVPPPNPNNAIPNTNPLQNGPIGMALPTVASLPGTNQNVPYYLTPSHPYIPILTAQGIQFIPSELLSSLMSNNYPQMPLNQPPQQTQTAQHTTTTTTVVTNPPPSNNS